MPHAVKLANLLLVAIFPGCTNFDRISKEESRIDRREDSEVVTPRIEMSKGNRGATKEKAAC